MQWKVAREFSKAIAEISWRVQEIGQSLVRVCVCATCSVCSRAARVKRAHYRLIRRIKLSSYRKDCAVNGDLSPIHIHEASYI